ATMSETRITADSDRALALQQTALVRTEPPEELDLHPLEGLARWLGRILHPIAFRMVSMVEQPLANMSGPITPNDGYFRRDRHRHPTIDPGTYTLNVTGVRNPRSFSLAELRDLPWDDRVLVMECAGNGNHMMGSAGLVGQAHWRGPSLSTVLKACGGLADTTTHFVFRGLDPIPVIRRGYHYGLSAQELNRADALLALEMNGVPLPRPRGFPVRLVVPGIYSMSHVKWLGAIEGLSAPHQGIHNTWVFVNKVLKDGNWVKQQARWIGLKSVVTRCLRTDTGYALTGWAWGGDRPIVRVEVSTDGGETWHDAKLRSPSEYFGEQMSEAAFERAWAVFDYAWDAPASGEHRVCSRAFDADGGAQVLEEDPNVKGHFNQTRVKWRRVQVP
ncbi:MAG: molybdopterin-dependent oxidoreductase, partial [Nannocystaceae bacterium]|nr:molybdopterin-dependent oxidoreductase [Nannocystaceae bacterium]